MQMEKMFWLLRHPPTLWTRKLLGRAEGEGRDVEFYIPPKKEGYIMAFLLAEHIVSSLGRRLEGSKIFSSPINRAKVLAEIILAWTEPDINPAFPQDIVFEDCLAEIPWKDSTAEAYDIVYGRAEEQKVHFLELEFTDDPVGTVNRYNRYLGGNIKPAICYLREAGVELNFVVSHSGFTGTTLWAIDRISSEGRKLEDLVITEGDLPALKHYLRAACHTSISEVRWVDGKWSILSVGERPHLKDREDLQEIQKYW